MHVRILTALAGCLCFAPFAVHAAACDGFADVDSTNATYCSAVAFIKDKGVTLGCTDASHYCPNDYVTRLQMALFMQRLSRGGSDNVLPDATSTIGGGNTNEITGTTARATIGGGSENKASDKWPTVGGGWKNTASGRETTVGGGAENEASGEGATVGGGIGNVASGDTATVPGGYHNQATASDSFAAGVYATADQDQCAVFSLWSSVNGMSCFGSKNIFRIAGDHGFSVDYGDQRPDHGGMRWVAIGDVFDGAEISTSTGAFLSTGGIWTNNSDVAAKTDFAEVDTLDVLDRVTAMPLSTWRYRTENGQRHLGPMAQDFHAAFGLGADDKHITTLDESGVALAAIKGLNQRLEATRGELAAQRVANAALQQRLLVLERAIIH